MSNTQTKHTKDYSWAARILKSIIRLFSWMPYWLVQWTGTAIGYLLIWLPNSHKNIARKNLAVAYPHLSEDKQQQRVKQTLISLGKVTAELGAAWCWPYKRLQPLFKEVKGQALLDNAIAQQKGIIFLAPHMGNWELAGSIVSAQHSATFLYRPPNLPSIESFMVNARGRFGAALAPTNLRGVRTLIKALNNQEATAILPDQDPGASGGVYAPFFGRPARTMTLVSKLIQRTDSTVLFIVLRRLPNAQGFCLHYLPADPDIASSNELTAATALNRGVEKCIQLAPEQYLWSYKRYRKPPKTMTDIYKKG
ncbi:MAG: lysophospholipid acyltransferase family protein [Thiomicrorhabdus sp.]|nr:lysophospholipid acyltransferase family protein [Thiomicrorhabdus sp.]